MDFELLPMTDEHWPRVRAIYAEGIATGYATFETEPPAWEAFDADHLSFARLVARRQNDILGWAALSAVSSRSVYEGVAEISIYVDEAARGQGIGTALLDGLIEASEAGGIWTLQAGIFPENRVSITLHLRAGFREVGWRERLGRLHGVWRDVVLLERRSEVAGVE